MIPPTLSPPTHAGHSTRPIPAANCGRVRCAGRLLLAACALNLLASVTAGRWSQAEAGELATGALATGELATGALATGELATGELATLRAAAESITAKDLQGHVEVLADDTFEGREAGTRGGHAAAGYLAKAVETRGLQPAGDNGSYYQSFNNGYRNILALLEGSDPDLKQQVIVVGAHYDHVGYGSRSNSYGPYGYIHNGADDNASGVAGVLEVVDALLGLTERPRRSVLFAFFDGEEKGLLGSKHWSSAPTLPLDRVAFMVNCDMIGRMQDERMEVYGTRSAAGLRRFVTDCNQLSNLSLDFTWEMKENSDHYSFFARRIPVIMLHTGLHPDYHRPSDDSHRLNNSGMQEAARLLLGIVHQLANQAEIGPFRPAASQESPDDRESLETPLPPAEPRMGVVSRAVTGDRPGLVIEEVARYSPAANAGLRAGDRWVSIAGKPIVDMVQFRLDILAAPPSVPVVVLRDGAEQPTEFPIQLSGKPVRVGISWREDHAEPGTAIVTQVAFGSPAQVAGVEVRDRIYAINGGMFPSGVELRRLLLRSPGPLRLLVERNGRMRTAILQVPEPFEMVDASGESDGS